MGFWVGLGFGGRVSGSVTGSRDGSVGSDGEAMADFFVFCSPGKIQMSPLFLGRDDEASKCFHDEPNQS